MCYNGDYCELMYYDAVLCSDMMSKQLDQYAELLRRTGSLCRNFAVPARLHCLLGNLVVQSLHHRDIVQSELAMPFILIQRHVCLYVKIMHCLFHWLLVIGEESATDRNSEKLRLTSAVNKNCEVCRILSKA